MERLTHITEIGNAYFPKCFEKPCYGMGKCIDNNCNLVNEVCKKLAEYETLEEQGLLVRLPCKVGDTVYKIAAIANHSVIPMNVLEIHSLCYDNERTIMFSTIGDMGKSCYRSEDIGEIVFLTREEAEKKLEKMKK